MTVERRRLWLAGGFAVLAILVVLVLLRPGAPGPGSQPSTSPSVTPSPTASSTVTASPASTVTPSGSTPTSLPSPTQAPAATPTALPSITGIDASGTWSGTWTDLQPDTESGGLHLTLTQSGGDLEGTVVMDANSCLGDGAIQGTIAGNTVDLRVNQRDVVGFTGTISGNRMSGTFSMSCSNANGTWVVTRGS
jgi:hypothetical protein